MNDLPETLPGILRCMADTLDGPQNAGNLVVPAIIGRFRDAADTIESLEAENAVLREQLAEKGIELQTIRNTANQFKQWFQEATAERDALRAQQEQPNEPLTLDELRQMEGEPVWVECLVQGSLSCWGYRDEDGVCGYCATFSDGDYGGYWLAYHRKPEQEEV